MNSPALPHVTPYLFRPFSNAMPIPPRMGKLPKTSMRQGKTADLDPLTAILDRIGMAVFLAKTGRFGQAVGLPGGAGGTLPIFTRLVRPGGQCRRELIEESGVPLNSRATIHRARVPVMSRASVPARAPSRSALKLGADTVRGIFRAKPYPGFHRFTRRPTAPFPLKESQYAVGIGSAKPAFSVGRRVLKSGDRSPHCKDPAARGRGYTAWVQRVGGTPPYCAANGSGRIGLPDHAPRGLPARGLKQTRYGTQTPAERRCG